MKNKSLTDTPPLVWTLAQAAHALGGISTRTVRRMIESGELPSIRLPGSLRREGTRSRPILGVRPEDVKALIERCADPAHNHDARGNVPAEQRGNTCPINEKTVPFTGRPTPTRAARELDALLARPASAKRNGSSKLTSKEVACRRVKIEDFRIHDLRHTCAAWLVSSGVPLPEVRDLLEHAPITMTEKYAHLAPDNVRSAVAALDRLSRSSHAAIKKAVGDDT